MAKEIREIIAMHEKHAKNDAGKLARLGDLRTLVDYAEQTGVLSASMLQVKVAQVEKLKPSNSATLEIPTVSEELYKKTREALKKEGLTFVVAVDAVSVGQLAASEATKDHLGYVNPSENMRAIVPSQMEIAIDPKNVRIKGSNSRTTDSQIAMISAKEADLRGKLPAKIRGLINMRVPNASTLVQLDSKYQEETGKPLFTDYFGRTDDQTVPGNVASVGRFDPSYRLDVDGCIRGHGRRNVFAVPVVVLPRKS